MSKQTASSPTLNRLPLNQCVFQDNDEVDGPISIIATAVPGTSTGCSVTITTTENMRVELFFFCNVTFRCIFDQARLKIYLFHHFIAGVNTSSTINTLQLSSISNINTSWTNQDTLLTIYTITKTLIFTVFTFSPV